MSEHGLLLTEEIKDKWQEVLDMEDAEPIRDRTTAINLVKTLETTTRALNEENETGNVDNWDPILINMIRRTQPSLVSNGMFGMQPMNGPTGLVFVMRVHYQNANGSRTETWNQTPPDTARSKKGADNMYSTQEAERLGRTDAGQVPNGDPLTQTGLPWKEMAFTIEKSSVTAESRAMKARYTRELEQDLRRMHGQDAGAELVNILRGEIIAEVDRENITNLRSIAVHVRDFDLDADTDARWEVEKAKALCLKVEREANKTAIGTRRGRANFIVTSADIAAFLSMSGKVDNTTAVGGPFDFNPAGPHVVGRLAGTFTLIIDPYLFDNEILLGYKGPTIYDAGYFMCPYVGLEFMRSQGEEDFNPRIGFKQRYGLKENPFAVITDDDSAAASGMFGQGFAPSVVPSYVTDFLGQNITADWDPANEDYGQSAGDPITRYANQYYRRFKVTGTDFGTQWGA